MNRRAFVYGAIPTLAVAREGETQQTTKIYRVGFLRNGPPPDTFLDGLRRGLRDLGTRKDATFVLSLDRRIEPISSRTSLPA